MVLAVWGQADAPLTPLVQAVVEDDLEKEV